MNYGVRLCKKLCFGVALAVMLFGCILSARAAGLNVEVHSPDEIRSFISARGSKSDKITYDVEPSLTAPFSPGRLSMDTQANALAELNTVRYIAGLNPDVILDPTYMEQAQAATFINRLNHELTHYPGKPAGVSDDLYQLGATGAGRSNLGRGYDTLITAIRNGWMGDSDSKNISKVGHRRWILNPTMQKTGFGYTDRFTAMYALDMTGSGWQSCVSWPGQNMPADYFKSNFAWSLSVGSGVSPDTSVKLTRVNDGRTWTFGAASSNGAYYIDNANYGQPGCIIFRPDEIDGYYDGDIFDVEITGLRLPVTYRVTFFSLQQMSVFEPARDNIRCRIGQTLKIDQAFLRNFKTIPANASALFRATCTSSDESVVSVGPDGTLHCNAEGISVVTVEMGGMSTAINVYVAKNGIDVDSLSGILKYKIQNGTAVVTGVMNERAKTIIIPAIASVNGKILPVTGIAAKAFSQMRNLNHVVIGANVEKIGAKAFFNCKKLKRIDIYPTRLNQATVGNNAFKNTNAKAIVTVHPEKKDSYKKLLQKKGLSKKAVFR